MYYKKTDENKNKNLFSLINLIDFRAYDQAAIKFRGVDADINFALYDYKEDIKKVS